MGNLINLGSVGYEVPARYQSGNAQLACEYKARSLEMGKKNLQRAMRRRSPRGRAGSWEAKVRAHPMLSLPRGHGREESKHV